LRPGRKKTVLMKATSSGSAVAQEFKRIMRENGGKLSVDAALEAARSPANPLHEHLEWDDSVAGEQYRRQQILHLFRAQMVLIQCNEPTQEVFVRAFLPKSGGESVYLERPSALLDKDARALFIDRQIGVLRAWCREATDTQELAGLRGVILAELGRHG